MKSNSNLWLATSAVLLAFVLICMDTCAQAPVQRNSMSTNLQGTPVIGNLRFTNTVTGGWIQFDSGGLAVFDKDGQENGRIFGVATGGIAMEFGAAFSGLLTNGSMVIHTRDGTKDVVTIDGDFTSQTGFMLTARTNSGAAQYVFTVDSGGTIYSRSLLSWRALYTDGSTNIVSATNTPLSYLANTVQVNFASSPYQSFQMTNDTVFTNQNQQVGRAITIKMLGWLTNCAISFPAGWVFLGAGSPATLISNKTAILSLTAFGTDPTNIIAAYAVQP